MHSVRVGALFGHLPVSLKLSLFLCPLFRVKHSELFFQVLCNSLVDLPHWCFDDFELGRRQLLRQSQQVSRGDDDCLQLAYLCVEMLNVLAFNIALATVVLTAKAVIVIDVVLCYLNLRSALFLGTA